MIGKFFRWLIGPEEKPVEVEQIGEVRIERAFGEAILAEPKRRNLCIAIRDRLEGLYLEEKVQLIDTE